MGMEKFQALRLCLQRRDILMPKDILLCIAKQYYNSVNTNPFIELRIHNNPAYVLELWKYNPTWVFISHQTADCVRRYEDRVKYSGFIIFTFRIMRKRQLTHEITYPKSIYKKYLENIDSMKITSTEFQYLLDNIGDALGKYLYFMFEKEFVERITKIQYPKEQISKMLAKASIEWRNYPEFVDQAYKFYGCLYSASINFSNPFDCANIAKICHATHLLSKIQYYMKHDVVRLSQYFPVIPKIKDFFQHAIVNPEFRTKNKLKFLIYFNLTHTEVLPVDKFRLVKDILQNIDSHKIRIIYHNIFQLPYENKKYALSKYESMVDHRLMGYLLILNPPVTPQTCLNGKRFERFAECLIEFEKTVPNKQIAAVYKTLIGKPALLFKIIQYPGTQFSHWKHLPSQFILVRDWINMHSNPDWLDAGVKLKSKESKTKIVTAIIEEVVSEDDSEGDSEGEIIEYSEDSD